MRASRRAFLRGSFAEAPVMRPYGAGTEAAFTAACSACGDCLSACPQAILSVGRDGRPVMSLADNDCTFCGGCIAACDTGALAEGRAWTWRASAGAECLSVNGVQCRACQDHCDAGAIRFRPMTGGRARPEFDAAACTGCGACTAPCPVDAIGFAQPQPATETRTC